MDLFGMIPLILAILALLFWSGKSQGATRNPNGNFSPNFKILSTEFDYWPLLVDYLKFRSDGKSIRLGRKGLLPIYLPPTDSLLVFGPTRSGKTTSLAIPILSEFRGPAVVTSVKEDILGQSLAGRRSLGECEVFDLSSSQSSSWNLFSMAEDFAGAKMVADALCRLNKHKGGDIEFWSQLAAKMLGPLILAASLAQPNLSTIFSWIESHEFEPAFEALTNAQQWEARSALEGIVRLDSRTLTSVIATLLSLLEPYGDPFICELLSTDGIEISSLLDRKSCNTLYICSPLFRSERYLPIYELFLRKLLEVAYQDADHKILFLLDELANVAPIPDLDKVASTSGSYGIVLVSIFQDLSQLEAIYGIKSRTVLNNHRSKLCLSGISDIATLDYVEKVASGLNSGKSKGNLLFRLRIGQALLVRSNYRPQKISLIPVRRPD